MLSGTIRDLLFWSKSRCLASKNDRRRLEPIETSISDAVIQVCMGPRPHLWFWEHIPACLAQEYQDHMGSRPHLWFCPCKTETLGLEFKVSVSPKPHLWVLCMQNSDFRTSNTSLYGSQNSPVILFMQKCVPSIRMTSLYVSQPSSVVLCIQQSDFRTRLACHYGFQTSLVVLCMHYSVISTRLTCLYLSQPLSVVLHAKQRLLDRINKYLWVPDITCRFVHAKERDLNLNY